MVICKVKYANAINKDSIESIDCEYVNMKTLFCAEGDIEKVEKVLKKLKIDPFLIWEKCVKGKKVQLYELTQKEANTVEEHIIEFIDIKFKKICDLNWNRPVEEVKINEKNLLIWKEWYKEGIDLFEYADNMLTTICDFNEYSKEQIYNFENKMQIIKDLANINDMSIQRFLNTYYD